jgi:plasmid stability protein
MSAIHVRNVPEEVSDGVKALARAHRRSMEAETLEILSRAVSGDPHPRPRHVNFELIRIVDLGEIQFEPMTIHFREPEF